MFRSGAVTRGVMEPIPPAEFSHRLPQHSAAIPSTLDGSPATLHHKPACLLQAQGNVLGSGLRLLGLQDATHSLRVGHLAQNWTISDRVLQVQGPQLSPEPSPEQLHWIEIWAS